MLDRGGAKQWVADIKEELAKWNEIGYQESKDIKDEYTCNCRRWITKEKGLPEKRYNYINKGETLVP